MANILIINRIEEGLFTHTLTADGETQTAIDNAPNLTSFWINGVRVMDFKTKNGAPLVRNQRILPSEITITDSFGSTPPQTGFTNDVQVWNALGALGYFQGFSGGSGGGGVDSFINLTDVNPNLYLGFEGMVYVVNETATGLEPVIFYNYNNLTQLDDVEIDSLVPSDTGKYVAVSMVDGEPKFTLVTLPNSGNDLPNGFTNLGTQSLVDGEYTATVGYEWNYQNIHYGLVDDFTATINPAGEGNSRIDVIHTVPGTNEFAKTEGTVSAGQNTAVKPATPVGALEVTILSIYEDSISEPIDPITGEQFITKSSYGWTQSNISGENTTIIYQSDANAFELINPALVSIDSVAVSIEDSYNGQQVWILNKTGNSVTLNNNASGGLATFLPFIFPLGQDMTIANNGLVRFKRKDDELLLDSYNIGGDDYSVLSVTGNSVDNSDPRNPIINATTIEEVQELFDSEISEYTSLWNKEAFNYSGSQEFELSVTPLSIFSYILTVNGKTANLTNTSLSGKIITVLFQLELGDVIEVIYQYSASLVGTIDKNLDLQNRGLLPPKDYSQSIYIDKINDFVEKYRKRESDVTLVQIGDSISTDLGYTTPNPNASTSPPFMTETNVNTALESKLRWKEQKYKRYDVSGTFTEILGGGTSSIISTDDAWSLVGASHRFPLTKVITGGTNAGVSFSMSAGIRRLGFIHHTDFKFATQTQVTITEGNGKVEVFDETDETWKEANGFVFSAKESSSLLPSGIYKDQDQKRLELRSLTDLTAKTISIKNIGTGRFGYWGIEYSPKEFMFKYIASSIGGTDIFQFRKFEEWRVDAFSPDLILQQCNIINEAAQAGGDPSYPPQRTPQNFRNSFETYYDALLAKDYLVLPYILFVGIQGGIVNPSTGEWGVGTFAGKEVTIDDYIGQLSDLYQSKNAPYLNCFYQYLEIAYNLARQQGTNNIFASAIYGTGVDGTSFTKDNVHLNNYGQEIAKRLLTPIFNL